MSEGQEKAIDPGVRSCRVVTTNNSEFNLNVSSVRAVSGEWDPKNKPTIDQLIPARGGSATWVIFTDDRNEDVIGEVQLIGAGNPDPFYRFENLVRGGPLLRVDGNSVLHFSPNPPEKKTGAHPIWTVTWTQK